MDLMATNHVDVPMVQSLIREGDELKKNGQLEQAIDLYLAAAKGMETPPASVCLRLARSYERLGDRQSACRWALAVVDVGDEFPSWQSACAVLERCNADGGAAQRRSVRLALTGSFTTTQLAQTLRLAA